MGGYKVRVVCDEKKRVDIEKKLIGSGFVVCDSAEDWVLTENTTFLSTISARDGEGERIIVKTEDIEYFESYGHDVYMIAADNQRYKLNEKMYELEGKLPSIFIRIGQSAIVNKQRIKRIIPSLFLRFDVITDSGARLTVTRSYYYRFRETMGI